ncbi:MAG: FimV/HubP family polar landmark protein, partial [Enterovibrio sp.]
KPLLNADEPVLVDDKEPPLTQEEEKSAPSFAFDLDDEELTKQLDQEFAELIEQTNLPQEISKKEEDLPLVSSDEGENLQVLPAQEQSRLLDENDAQSFDAQETEFADETKVQPSADLASTENETRTDVDLTLDEPALTVLEQEQEQEAEPEPQIGLKLEPENEAPLVAKEELEQELEKSSQNELKTEDLASAAKIEIASVPKSTPKHKLATEDSLPAESLQQAVLPQESAPKKDPQTAQAKKALPKDVLSQLNPGQKLNSLDEDSLQVAGLDIATLWDESEEEAEPLPQKDEPSFDVSAQAFDEDESPEPSFDEVVTAKSKAKKLAARKPKKPQAKSRPIEPTWQAEQETELVESMAAAKPIEELPQEDIEFSDAPFISLKALLDGDNDDAQLEQLAREPHFDKYEKLLAEISPVEIDFAGSDENKLALAKAYVEMKDFEGARPLLESLLSNEDDALRAQAHDLYIKLPKK